MITVITGLPGHGKTCNCIAEVRDYAKTEGRQVYYHNITDLSPELGWHHFEEPQKWFELPPGSIVVIDECQNFFPARSSGKTAPEHIAKMNIHRHFGMDLFLITQNPKLIDHDIRYLVNRHLHFFRPFGLKLSTRIEWARCMDDPFSEKNHKSALSSSKVPLPKDVFDLYKSAELHTVKVRLPKKLLVLPTLLILLPLLVWYVFGKLKDPVSEETKQKISPSQPVSPGAVAQSLPVPSPTPEPPMGAVRGSFSTPQGMVYLLEDDHGYRRVYASNCILEVGEPICVYRGRRYERGVDVGERRSRAPASAPQYAAVTGVQRSGSP